MSGFTERLLARGAGRPVGLPLLRLRPAARFEAEAPAAPLEQPAAAGADPAPVVATHKPASMTREPTHETPLTLTSPVDAEAVPAIPFDARAVSSPTFPPDRPSPQERETATADQGESPSPPRAASLERGAISAAHPDALPPEMRMNDDRSVIEERGLPFDASEARPVVRGAPAIEKRSPPAPTISIGRIDVQFLPQDQPPAPSRAEPSRTRGFDAYARARRGLPR